MRKMTPPSPLRMWRRVHPYSPYRLRVWELYVKWSPVVPPPTPSGGAPSGAPKGGDPSGTPKDDSSPKEKKVIPTPLVEVERKLKPKVREPAIQKVITPVQRELVEELQRMQGHDPDIVS